MLYVVQTNAVTMHSSTIYWIIMKFELSTVITGCFSTRHNDFCACQGVQHACWCLCHCVSFYISVYYMCLSNKPGLNHQLQYIISMLKLEACCLCSWFWTLHSYDYWVATQTLDILSLVQFKELMEFFLCDNSYFRVSFHTLIFLPFVLLYYVLGML